MKRHVMPEPRQMCLACLQLIPVGASTCPECGAHLAAMLTSDDPVKLIHALHHPLGDVRIRAAIALGGHHEASAAQPLLRLALRDPADILEGFAVVGSLLMLGESGRSALHELAEQQLLAPALREAAADALLQLGSPGEPHA